MPGEHIISVLGDRDTVTPGTLVHGQLDYWEVPDENRYHYDRGHFTIPLGMINDDTALKAFAKMLQQI
jgi:hypothetical protein